MNCANSPNLAERRRRRCHRGRGDLGDALVVGASCVVAPLALEWTGVLPPTLEFTGDRLRSVAQMANLREAPTLVYLVMSTVVPMVAVLFVIVRIRDRLASAEKRLRLRAWQLRQILPASPG